jgi:hypothetical protein
VSAHLAGARDAVVLARCAAAAVLVIAALLAVWVLVAALDRVIMASRNPEGGEKGR